MEYREMYDELIKKISLYHPAKSFPIVDKAYNLAVIAHKDQFRKSGEPYIIHPLAVAILLAELELDLESIVAGILHDVIEDTEYTYENIVSMFSEEVAELVNGVTKLEKIEYTSKEEEQAENYRKMFLAMAKDIRVILIKIADRLHNMRTLKFQSEKKQREKAQETLDIYAPLAHRLGISKLRYDLEDLSFKYLDPEAYYDLADKISRKQSERQAFIDKIVAQIDGLLIKNNIHGRTEGRPKHFFSIYKKMKSQNKSMDQIYDLFAVRVIVNNQHDCYEVLGIVHEAFKPVPGRFKDYIGMPKANHYQSLHTTMISPEGDPFEVQIRTWDMHRTAEYGIAAHWKYKQGDTGQVDPDSEEAKLSWLRQILEWQREMSDNKEYLHALKVDLDVFKDHVYCFTPKGDVISLVSGATPVDYAYAIHSAVGNKMVGARVNGKIVNFDHVLKTGDQVEVLTSQNSKGPSADWLKLAKTTQARNKINQWFKRINKDENIIKGKDLLEKEAKKKNLNLSELLNDKRQKAVLNRFNFVDWDSMCAAIGHGGLKESQVINKLHDDYISEIERNVQNIEIPISTKDHTATDRKKKSGIVVKGVGDISVRFSRCCTPVPGDEIVGFVTRGRGVSIHRTDCINIMNMDEIERSRFIEAEWQLPEKGSAGIHYTAELKLLCDEKMGLLFDISRVITEERISVKSMSARTQNAEAVFNLGIEIASREELDRLCNRMLKLAGVHEIVRV